MAGDFWTPGEEASLRAWWAEGLSAGEIGRRLKRAQTAVYAKACVMGLPRRARGGFGPAKMPPVPRFPRPVEAPPPMLPPVMMPAALNPVTLPSSAGCQFPLWSAREAPPWPPRFCGARVEAPGRSWCAAHRQIVFAAPWQAAAE